MPQRTPAEAIAHALAELDAARECLADAKRWLSDSYATPGLPAAAIDGRAYAETSIQQMNDEIIAVKSHLLHAIASIKNAGD